MNRSCEGRRDELGIVFLTELTRERLSRARSHTEPSGRSSSSKGTERVKCEILTDRGSVLGAEIML